MVKFWRMTTVLLVGSLAGCDAVDETRVAPLGRAEQGVVTTCGGSAVPSNTTWVQPGYSWWQNQQWFLKGDGVTPTESTLELQFTEPPGITGVHVNWHCVRGYLKTLATGAIRYLGTSAVAAGNEVCGNGSTCLRKIQFDVGTADLAPGNYEVLLAADDQNTTFARRAFKVSAPLYLILSTDWDFPNSYGQCSGQSITDWMDSLRGRPGFAFSHFVGAYMWQGETGAALSPAIEQWLLCRSGRLPSSGTCSPPASPDEIGVHVHGHKAELLNYVPLPSCCLSSCAAGTPATNCAPPTIACVAPAVCPHVNERPAYADNWDTDASGYAQLLRAFGSEELVEILNYSSRVLVRHGFAQPTSIRAGGWSSGPNVLAVFPSTTRYGLNALGALEVLGTGAYTVDSSAVPPDSVCTDPPDRFCKRLKDGAGLSSTTTPASQPYISGGTLVVPDNGALVDYRYSSEIATDLAAVFTGEPLATPRVYQFPPA